MSDKNPLNPQTPSNPFRDNLENKSLEQVADEAKGADAPSADAEDPGVTPALAQPEPLPGDAVVAEDEDAPLADGVEVVLTHHLNYDGRALIPGEKVTVPAEKAHSWIASKRASAV